jgi:hypothetical protein
MLMLLLPPRIASSQITDLGRSMSKDQDHEQETANERQAAIPSPHPMGRGIKGEGFSIVTSFAV